MAREITFELDHILETSFHSNPLSGKRLRCTIKSLENHILGSREDGFAVEVRRNVSSASTSFKPVQKNQATWGEELSLPHNSNDDASSLIFNLVCKGPQGTSRIFWGLLDKNAVGDVTVPLFHIPSSEQQGDFYLGDPLKHSNVSDFPFLTVFIEETTEPYRATAQESRNITFIEPTTGRRVERGTTSSCLSKSLRSSRTVENPDGERFFKDLKSARPNGDGWSLSDFAERWRTFEEKYGWYVESVGITWSDLVVELEQNSTDAVPTVASQLKGTLKCSKKTTTRLVDRVSGYVKPGQMLLLLGTPDSGAATLMKALAGMLDKRQFDISGSVLYNQEPGPGKYRPRVRFVSEDDTHIPSLTVHDTLLFAAELSIPPEMPQRGEIIELLVTTAEHLLGIHHVRHTVVGNELLRGVSGGEKKRVTIAEMIVSREPVLFLDNFTKGLDAAASLDIVKSMRAAARGFGTCFVSTIYQASEDIVNLYDNVCLMREGRCIYFGPPQEALGYFEELGFVCPPRRTFPDFLTSIGDGTIAEDDKEQWGETEPQHYLNVAPHDLDIYEEPELDAMRRADIRIPQGKLFAACGSSISSVSGAHFLRVRFGWILASPAPGASDRSTKVTSTQNSSRTTTFGVEAVSTTPSQPGGLPSGIVEHVPVNSYVLYGRTGEHAYINGIYDKEPGAHFDGRPVFRKRGSSSPLLLHYHAMASAWILSTELSGKPVALNETSASEPTNLSTPWKVLDRSLWGTHRIDADIRFICFGDAPMTTAELAAAFQASNHCRLVELQFPTATAPPPANPSPEFLAYTSREYATGALHQITKIALREYTLLKKAPGEIGARLGRFVMMGLMMGALFWNLPKNDEGLYNRGGLLFMCSIMISTASYSFIPIMIDRRNVFYKHRNAFFFRPLWYFLSVLVADIPFMAIEVMIFGSVVYWMAGLNAASSGMRFIYFLVNFFVANFAISTYVRMSSTLASSAAEAQAISSSGIVVSVLFCGFLIPRGEIPDYFIWLHYISPFKYIVEGIFMNEFDGLTFHLANNETLNGTSYVANRYDISPSDPDAFKWGQVAITAAYIAVFALISIISLSKLTFGSTSGAASQRVFFARKKRRSSGGAQLRGGQQGAGAGEGDVVVEIAAPPTHNVNNTIFSWHDLSYEVDVKPEKGAGLHGPTRKTLLSHVHGYVQSGSMIALMGASGAGKTTLLDVLARRKTGGYTTGKILVNGVEQGDSFNRICGYVEQMDIHAPRATVRETILFSAQVRLPQSVSKEEKLARALKVADVLGLTPLLDAVIGSPEMAGGLPAEARKRVTIAVELVTNPAILFLDEPTSGLSSSAALRVLRAARQAASLNCAVICTIHQPSMELFEMFDGLLLLQKGGHTVYNGPIGTNSRIMLNYFTKHGAEQCGNQNPADYILTQIGAGITGRATKDWVLTWSESEEKRNLLSTMNTLTSQASAQARARMEAGASFSAKVRALLIRTFRSYWRDPAYNYTRIIFSVFMGILLGLAYLNTGNDQAGLQARVAVLFFSTVVCVIAILNAMGPILVERSVYYREKAVKAYHPLAYDFVTVFVEIPFLLFTSVIFCFAMYWLVGLKAEAFPYFLLMYCLLQLFSVSFGQLLAVWSSSTVVAQQLGPAVTSIWNLFVGFLIPKPSIPNYFIWLYYINPFTYFLEGVVSNELHDMEFTCTPNDSPCYKTGDEFLNFYGMDYNNRWRNVGILVALLVAMRILTYVGIAYKVHQTR